MFTYLWITTWLLSAKCVMTFASSYERYYVLIYQKVDTSNTSLSCLSCFNGDATNDCMTLQNISNIPKRTCMSNEQFCKVRRLTRDDKLVTFDRYCDSFCKPGCRDGARYTECVSCCNARSNCNVDNAAPSCPPPEIYVVLPFLVVIHLLAKY